MNHRITRRKVAKQFIIAIEMLLEWIEQEEGAIENQPNSNLVSQVLFY